MSHRTVALLAAGLALAPAAQAQTASDALDAIWVSACAAATPGTDFYLRCQEILNAGPGSGGRRSAAAIGNNLELFAAQGRLLVALAKARARAGKDAADDGDEAAADWLPLSAEGGEAGGTLARGGRWALFGSVAAIDGGREESDFERGFDADGRVLLLGLDYRFNDRWSGLVALQRESRDTDFLFGSGQMDADTDLFSAGLAYAGDNGVSAGLTLNAGRLDARVRREIAYTLVLNAGQPNESVIRIESESDSENDARLFGADFHLGREQASGAWTWRYGADLSWSRTRMDPIIESNDRGLAFEVAAQRVTSLQLGAGVELARTLSSRNGVWQPYARLRWLHEFQDDPRQIAARFRGGDNVFRLSFSTAEPDRSFGEFGLGIVGVFTGGWQAYAGWQRLLGHGFMDEDRLDVGWRREF